MSKQGPLKPGEKTSVSPFGSLGLLAYGYKGLLAWRIARENHLQNGEIEPEEKPA